MKRPPSTAWTTTSATAIARRARAGRARTPRGRSRRCGQTPARPSASPATSCSCAPATTATSRATRPSSRARTASGAPIIHPQQWPEDLDYRGKRVVVIGSGATAMTLVPAMAKDVGHVVMLQRSPTYVVSRPDRDVIANGLRAVLPERWAYAITRWKNVALQQFLYRRTRTHPAQVKQKLLDLVRKELGPGLRRRDPLHAPLQPVGSATLPGAEQRPVRSDPVREGRRSSPTGSSASPRRASRSPPARSWRPTSS